MLRVSIIDYKSGGIGINIQFNGNVENKKTLQNVQVETSVTYSYSKYLFKRCYKVDKSWAHVPTRPDSSEAQTNLQESNNILKSRQPICKKSHVMGNVILSLHHAIKNSRPNRQGKFLCSEPQHNPKHYRNANVRTHQLKMTTSKKN